MDTLNLNLEEILDKTQGPNNKEEEVIVQGKEDKVKLPLVKFVSEKDIDGGEEELEKQVNEACDLKIHLSHEAQQ